MRGKKTAYNHGWYDMLMRCDAIESKNGEIKIFGSPVFVTYDTYHGYGWYYIGYDANWTYYQEKRNERKCDCVMKIGQIDEKTVILNSHAYNKIPYGTDYGYWKDRIDGENKLHFLKKVECELLQNVKIVNRVSEDSNEDFTVKAVCITTSIIEKKIHC